MAARRFGDGANGSGTGAVLPARELVLGDDSRERLCALVDLGALVSLSRSRDGGAHLVVVTFDGVAERKWFRDPGDLVLQLDEWAGLIEDAGGSSASGDQRDRRGRSGRR